MSILYLSSLPTALFGKGFHQLFRPSTALDPLPGVQVSSNQLLMIFFPTVKGMPMTREIESSRVPNFASSCSQSHCRRPWRSGTHIRVMKWFCLISSVYLKSAVQNYRQFRSSFSKGVYSCSAMRANINKIVVSPSFNKDFYT